MMTGDTVDAIFQLLQDSSGEQYFGEPVTKLQHAEQCAFHASNEGADDELVLAALLHDIGHLLGTPESVHADALGVVNHDEVGARWLREHGFSERVAALVGGHVDAKRYLTAMNARYLDGLSPTSLETLRLQGGPMEAAEATEFASHPYLRDILRLRSWDEMAKDPEWKGPELESYRERIRAHLESRSSCR